MRDIRGDLQDLFEEQIGAENARFERLILTQDGTRQQAGASTGETSAGLMIVLTAASGTKQT
jgi:hypothetical protein